MTSFKELLTLLLFSLAVVHFTLLLLNTQNLSVNDNVMKQVNTTKLLISKDVANLMKYLPADVKLNKYIKDVPYMDFVLLNAKCIFNKGFTIVQNNPISVIPIIGCLLQCILFVWNKYGRIQHFLACLLWCGQIYLLERASNDDENILLQIIVGFFLICLILQITLTKESKIIQLNISNPNISKDSTNGFKILSKRKLNDNTNDLFTKPRENIFLSESPKSFNIDNYSPTRINNSNSPKTIFANLDDNCLDSFKSLKLNNTYNGVNGRVNPHFQRKLYGKQVSELFVIPKRTTCSLSPPKLQNIATHSWGSGVYWKNYNVNDNLTSFGNSNLIFRKHNNGFTAIKNDNMIFRTNLSRSSSQSSGFSSQSDEHRSNIIFQPANNLTTLPNTQAFLSQFDDTLSVRSEPPYHF